MFGVGCISIVSIIKAIICPVVILIALVIIYKVLNNLNRYLRIDALDTRYILVTGCDYGFGRDLVGRLDGLGCRVFAGCLTTDGEEGLKQTCSDRVVTLSMDVSDPESVRAAYQLVCNKLPAGKGLWGVVNNAGVAGNDGPAEWLTLDDYRGVLDINLLGLIDVTVVFLPLVKRERGRVVNMASIMGRISFEGMGPYCISKYGVEAFSDSLRRQLSVWDVSVHIIEPGWFRTNITSTDNIKFVTQKLYNRCPPDIQEEYGTDYLDQVNFVADNVIERMRSDKTYLVVDAYVHALLGKYPRARYVVGIDAMYVLLAIQSLPTFMGDAILRANKYRPIPMACRK